MKLLDDRLAIGWSHEVLFVLSDGFWMAQRDLAREGLALRVAWEGW